MKRNLAILVAAASLGATAFTLAPATADPSPLDQYATQASALIAGAPVVDRGTDWGLPEFQFSFPSLSLNINVQAVDEATAEATATATFLPQVERSLWDAAGDPALATTTTPTQTVITGADTTTTTPATTTDPVTTTDPAPPVTTTDPATTTDPVTTTDQTTTTSDPSPPPELPVTGDVG